MLKKLTFLLALVMVTILGVGLVLAEQPTVVGDETLDILKVKGKNGLIKVSKSIFYENDTLDVKVVFPKSLKGLWAGEADAHLLIRIFDENLESLVDIIHVPIGPVTDTKSVIKLKLGAPVALPPPADGTDGADDGTDDDGATGDATDDGTDDGDDGTPDDGDDDGTVAVAAEDGTDGDDSGSDPDDGTGDDPDDGTGDDPDNGTVDDPDDGTGDDPDDGSNVNPDPAPISIPAGIYQIALVLTKTGGDPTNLNHWHKGFNALVAAMSIKHKKECGSDDNDCDGEEDTDADPDDDADTDGDDGTDDGSTDGSTTGDGSTDDDGTAGADPTGGSSTDDGSTS